MKIGNHVWDEAENEIVQGAACGTMWYLRRQASSSIEERPRSSHRTEDSEKKEKRQKKIKVVITGKQPGRSSHLDDDPTTQRQRGFHAVGIWSLRQRVVRTSVLENIESAPNRENLFGSHDGSQREAA